MKKKNQKLFAANVSINLNLLILNDDISTKKDIYPSPKTMLFIIIIIN